MNNEIPHDENKYLQKELAIDALVNTTKDKNCGKLKTFLHKCISKKGMF